MGTAILFAILAMAAVAVAEKLRQRHHARSSGGAVANAGDAVAPAFLLVAAGAIVVGAVALCGTIAVVVLDAAAASCRRWPRRRSPQHPSVRSR